jgi:hypothetical protein
MEPSSSVPVHTLFGRYASAPGLMRDFVHLSVALLASVTVSTLLLAGRRRSTDAMDCFADIYFS